MKKVLRVLLATLLTPFIMVGNIIIYGITFIVGVFFGSAKVIDKVIQGNQDNVEVNE